MRLIISQKKVNLCSKRYAYRVFQIKRLPTQNGAIAVNYIIWRLCGEYKTYNNRMQGTCPTKSTILWYTISDGFGSDAEPFKPILFALSNFWKM